MARRWSVILYLVNLAMLATHEVDSAYWHEWRLFGLPGGIQVFSVLHVPLFILLLYGFIKVVQGERDGYGFSLLMAVVGVTCFLIHTFFLLAGRPEFRLPVSLTLIGVILVVSLAQGMATLTERRHSAGVGGSLG